MAFRNIDRMDESERAAFSPFLLEPFTAEYFGRKPHKALKLLLTFRQSM